MDKKVIVITGSTRGIGCGLAIQFLKRGHRVIVNGRNRIVVDKKVTKLADRGYDVRGVAGDIVRETTFQDLIDEAMTKYGKIDIWINNAGIPQPQKYFDELGKNEIHDLVSVNLTGLMMGTRAAIHFFKKQGYGKIFNMEGFGSDGRMMDKLTLYGTTKRAVNYFTKSVSNEVKERSIQIGILSPGMVRTDFLKNAMSQASADEQDRNKKVVDILAEDVEPVAAFLVERILASTKQYDRIEYLTKRRLIPKLIRLMWRR